MRPASYDRGEQLRVTRDANGALRVHHGANEVATIKPVIGGDVKVTAGDRTWRLSQTEDGWEAAGDPPAALRRRALRSDVLIVGDTELCIGRRSVKGLLRFRSDDGGRQRCLLADILGPPPPHPDAHATVALATAAVVLGTDLRPDPAHAGINGDNISAATRYGHGL